MSDAANIASDDSPRCEKCGLEITTGAMAAFCPNATQCEFWPHSDGTPSGDGAELLIARMWIGNACEQIRLQIEDRKRLAEEGYEKCLRTWIDKHSGGREVLKALASISLRYATVVATLPPLKAL